jgi:hypothetical protein
MVLGLERHQNLQDVLCMHGHIEQALHSNGFSGISGITCLLLPFLGLGARQSS